MNKGKRANIVRISSGLFSLLVIMLCVGGLLGYKMNQMLTDNIENQVTEYAELVAEQVDQGIVIQFVQLNNIANAINNSDGNVKTVLGTVRQEQEGISVGMIALDGSVIFGNNIDISHFSGIKRSFRGEEAVSFAKGKGLLFSVPVYSGSNVKYVLYKMYDVSVLQQTFGRECYGGKGQVLLADTESEVIVPFLNEKTYSMEILLTEESKNGFEEIQDKMNIATSASTYVNARGGKYFLFVSEVAQHGIYTVGIVPEKALSEGMMYITTLVLWVFGLLLVLFLIGAAYVFFTAEKAQESDELREAKEDAERANRAKTDFLASMSHEIRTPIHAIMGMNEMVMRECENENVRMYSKNIQSASSNLLSLINDILDFSKIEAGKIEIVKEEYELKELLHDVVNIIQPMADEKELQFDVRVDKALPAVLQGDAGRIRQIIINLLNNAIKYTKEGKVSFHVSSANQSGNVMTLHIHVEDTGIGIKEEDIHKLFVDFERVDINKNRNIEGTGLGLAITNRLVTNMGGQIKLNSEYGKGSVFEVYIPQIVVGDGQIGDFQSGYETYVREQYVESFIAPDARILVVDDHELNLFVMESLLKANQVKTTICKSGAECLALVKKEVYDIILLDHMMPEMDGIETMQKILDNGWKRDTVVVALTANAIVGAKELYLEHGFDDYLSKPVDTKRLENMLIKYIPEHKVQYVVEKGKSISSENVAEEEKRMSECIDQSVGMKYCAHSREMYMEVLQMYCEVKEEKLEQVKNSFESEDWKSYVTYVHSMKSTSLSVGGVKLSELALSLEMAGKGYLAGEEDKLAYIKEHTQELMDLYVATVEEGLQILEAEA